MSSFSTISSLSINILVSLYFFSVAAHVRSRCFINFPYNLVNSERIGEGFTRFLFESSSVHFFRFYQKFLVSNLLIFLSASLNFHWFSIFLFYSCNLCLQLEIIWSLRSSTLRDKILPPLDFLRVWRLEFSVRFGFSIRKPSLLYLMNSEGHCERPIPCFIPNPIQGISIPNPEKRNFM